MNKVISDAGSIFHSSEYKVFIYTQYIYNYLHLKLKINFPIFNLINNARSQYNNNTFPMQYVTYVNNFVLSDICLIGRMVPDE